MHFPEAPSLVNDVVPSKVALGHSYNTSVLERSIGRHTVGQTECALTSIGPHHREVITIRTPLPLHDQESRV